MIQICEYEGCETPKPTITTKKGSSYSQKFCSFHWGYLISHGRQKNRDDPNRHIDYEGYVKVRVGNRFVMEHRIIMAQKIGRPLVKGESVHHINGIRHDNRQENLELWLGGIRYGQRASDVLCPHCGKAYLKM